MLCPLCTSRLVPGEPRRYESLDDHICCPNDNDYPLRPVMVCTNQKCTACWGKIFWDADSGEGPYQTNFQDFPWIDGNPCPFNSWERKAYFQINYHDEDQTWHWGKLAIKREVHYRSDDYGHKTGKQVHYRVIWDNIYYTNGFSMLHFGITHFYLLRKLLGEERAVEELRRKRWLDVVRRDGAKNHYWKIAATLVPQVVKHCLRSFGSHDTCTPIPLHALLGRA